MNFADLLDGVVMTEKSSRFSDSGNGGMVFYSYPWVTKKQVKSSMESFFKGVEIAAVNSINVKPKFRKFKGKVGFTKKRKKFFVSFAKGSVDLFSAKGGGA